MKICERCGRTSVETRVGNHTKSGMVLCEKHKNQFDRHGKFLEQTRYDPNKIIEDGHISYICLNDSYGNIIARAIIDTEDVPKVSKYKWFMRADNRVVSNITKSKKGSTHIRLHNLVMNFQPNEEYEVDHKNLNPLDNRKSNLRIGNKSKNLMNRSLQSNNNTGVCGVVSRDSNNTSPWVPQIKKDRKMKRLGTRRTFDEAVKVRLQAEATMFGVNSNNYNPQTNTIQLSYTSHDDGIETFVEVSLDGYIIKFHKNN